MAPPVKPEPEVKEEVNEQELPNLIKMEVKEEDDVVH